MRLRPQQISGLALTSVLVLCTLGLGSFSYAGPDTDGRGDGATSSKTNSATNGEKNTAVRDVESLLAKHRFNFSLSTNDAQEAISVIEMERHSEAGRHLLSLVLTRMPAQVAEREALRILHQWGDCLAGRAALGFLLDKLANDGPEPLILRVLAPALETWDVQTWKDARVTNSFVRYLDSQGMAYLSHLYIQSLSDDRTLKELRAHLAKSLSHADPEAANSGDYIRTLRRLFLSAAHHDVDSYVRRVRNLSGILVGEKPHTKYRSAEPEVLIGDLNLLVGGIARSSRQSGSFFADSSDIPEVVSANEQLGLAIGNSVLTTGRPNSEVRERLRRSLIRWFLTLLEADSDTIAVALLSAASEHFRPWDFNESEALMLGQLVIRKKPWLAETPSIESILREELPVTHFLISLDGDGYDGQIDMFQSGTSMAVLKTSDSPFMRLALLDLAKYHLAAQNYEAALSVLQQMELSANESKDVAQIRELLSILNDE